MSAAFTKMKRVTDPFDDEAKARIFGRRSDCITGCGGNCSPQSDADDVTLSSLSELFLGFNADDGGSDSCPAVSGAADCDDDRDPSAMHEYGGGACVDLIKPILRDLMRDAYKKVLTAHVSKAVQVFSCVRSDYKQIVRRNVVAYLRNRGYNAAVCNTKWESCGGLAAGSYEFIDVLRAENSTRYFVDLDFAAEFEIARPTSSYNRLMEHLPTVFVGTGEDLKQISKVVSDAAKRSLKSRGLHLPPWRKNRFMQNKWLGPHRRTTSLFPATFNSSASPADQSYGVKCRAVGFDAAVNGGGHLLLLATARTR